jgi:hypothetical protein
LFSTRVPGFAKIAGESTRVINIGVSRLARPACGLGPNAYIGESRLPTVLRSEPYRFFFYSADRNEPPHVHVEHQGNIAKIWIDPVRIADTGGLRRGELLDIERLTRENRDSLLETWNEFFGR